MSKFRRLSIEEAQREFPLLNEETRKALIGGLRLHSLGGEEQSVNDILGVCNNNAFSFDEGVNWNVDRSGNDFWDNYSYCSNSNHHTPIHWTEDCMSCYYETLKYCNIHNHYVPVTGCYEWELSKYTYCGEHGYTPGLDAPCKGCDKDEFLEKYPDGCYEHGAPYKESCSYCNESFLQQYPNGCSKHEAPYKENCSYCKEESSQ